MILGDLDLEMFSEISIRGCATGIRFCNPTTVRTSAFWGNFYDLSVTDCVIGLEVEAISAGNTVLIAHGEIEGSEYAIRSAVKKVPLRLSGMDVRGKVDADVLCYDDQFADPDAVGKITVTHGGYLKPNENLYVAELSAVKGKTQDAAPAIQKALDAAALTGGVVYLPAGTYHLYTPIKVPSGVQLRGAESIFTRDTAAHEGGTVLLTYVTDEATITLSPYSGMSGLRVWCPTNDPTTALEKIQANAPETKVAVIRGGGAGVYITNTVVVASYNAIDFRDCDQHFVKQVFGCSYLAHVTVGGVDGAVEEVLCNPNFIQRGSRVAASFDTTRVNAQRWRDNQSGEKQSAGAPFTILCNDILREYCTPFRAEGAQGERMLNCFMYASRSLLVVEDSTDVMVLNCAIDTLKGDNPMFDVTSSELTVVNAMRIFGTSLRLTKDSTVVIYQRNDRNSVWERPYDSSLDLVDSGADIGQLITERQDFLNCDSVPDDVRFGGDCRLVSGDNAKSGSAWEIKPKGDVLFSYSFPATDILDYCEDGYLHLWIYVEDHTKIGVNGQVELTSGGACDKEEWGWNLASRLKKSGWNELYLPFSGASISGGLPDGSAVNYMRVYLVGNDTTFIIDDIYFCR